MVASKVRSAKLDLSARQVLADRKLDPWEMVWGQPYIDAERLALALANDLQRDLNPDFRTRLLVRDACKALEAFWGSRRFARWLTESSAKKKIEVILLENLGKTGFHFIRRRLVANISRDQVEQVFELLGRKVHDRVEVHVAGSIPTMLKGLTSRPTDDIDFVDEVPSQIRRQRTVIRQIKTKYGLTLGHVQSHYLPKNWESRRQYLGDFGGIRVYLVDEYDVFVSKLSSTREEHQDDVRVMAPKLDKAKVKRLLLRDGKAFLESPSAGRRIEETWKFIYREPLFQKVNESE